MRIQLVSDCHLEFHSDGGQAFVDGLCMQAEGVDVLVIAGDFATSTALIMRLGELCDHFKHVVYVVGNHEFYGRVPVHMLHAGLDAFWETQPNFHWLNEGTVEIEGQRFVGCPLWFAKQTDWWMYKHYMSDFNQIVGFANWVFRDNESNQAFLRHNVGPDDVVVTHYLPAEGSVAKRFKGHTMNQFFLCDMEDLIQKAQPKLWLHGHTHDSMDYRIGETRVVCNPYGYKDHEVNPDWQADLVLEV